MPGLVQPAEVQPEGVLTLLTGREWRFELDNSQQVRSIQLALRPDRRQVWGTCVST